MTYKAYRPHGRKGSTKAKKATARPRRAPAMPVDKMIVKAIESAYGKETINGRELLAQDLGVTVGLISHWARGYRPIAAHHAMKIEKLSKGAVTAAQIAPKVFGVV
jgi:hypothetical protein